MYVITALDNDRCYSHDRRVMMTRISYSHDGPDGRARNIYWLFSRVLLYK